MTRRAALLLLGAVGSMIPAVAVARRKPRSSRMVDSARLFLAALDSKQREKATLAFNDAERLNWNFVPADRKGITLNEMNEAQQRAALELLRVGLSEKGYSKAETIRKLELVLREMENGNPGRDPGRYYFTIFGTPSEEAVWGWRYEGHHCSQNWTIMNGRPISSTPQFFGSNPAEVRSGPMKGTRVLSAEEDLARALVKSLDENQRREGVVEGPAPPEIITGRERQVAIIDNKGIPYSSLKKEQQGMLLALIEEYAGAQQADLAAERLAKLRAAGLENIRFAWIGAVEKGQGHYYRIQGSTFLIEYDNTQNNANHIHTVWRDFKGDFGRDILAEHHLEHPH